MFDIYVDTYRILQRAEGPSPSEFDGYAASLFSFRVDHKEPTIRCPEATERYNVLVNVPNRGNVQTLGIRMVLVPEEREDDVDCTLHKRRKRSNTRGDWRSRKE